MKPEKIMIRYGELMTKGHNKQGFLMRLHLDIKTRLKELKDLTYERTHDQFFIVLHGIEVSLVTAVLKKIPGIHSISLVYQAPLDLEAINDLALALLKDVPKDQTFRVTTKRANKRFMTSSEDISKEVGATIFHRLNLKVSLKKPDITLFLDIKDQAAFLYFEKELCLGGYPLNSLGKGLMLLSGGIDSPVASYLLIKRGIKLDFIHFAAPPYTSEGVIYKLKDIIAVLNEYQVNSRLFVIPFTKLQETIYEMSDVSYAITIMRRMMVRISTLVAKKYRIPVLATGESVGQVASQTLSSINTINEVTIYPILRPLSVLDKVDIIKLSQGIGLYEISIRPFEDCCTIFPVINPKTRPRVKVSKSFEAKFDYQALIDEAVKNLRIIKVSSKDIL